MYRSELQPLSNWKIRKNRKPLVLRGARQVGKTTLIRIFAKQEFSNLVELNFERNPEYKNFFISNDPKEICKLLEIQLKEKISIGKTLLFLDEVQACPEIFSKLRYFYEEMPELHVIAAGSLLDFVLNDHTFSMPVGRIEYFYIYPMGFEDFLLALNEEKLLEFIRDWTFKKHFPEALHNRLNELLKLYTFVGGMPEAVKEYSESRSYAEVLRVQSSILSTFKNDFIKYRNRMTQKQVELIEASFLRIPHLVGNKLKYTEISREFQAKEILTAIKNLKSARIMDLIYSTSASGIPLSATKDEKSFKILFLDVGLMMSALKLNILDLNQITDLNTLKDGAISEQLIGQHLKFLTFPVYEDSNLYYWEGQSLTSKAEIDYILQEKEEIIPVEVKSGKYGKLRSLQRFIEERNPKFALRFYAGYPIQCKFGSMKKSVLISIPHYMIEQYKRFV